MPRSVAAYLADVLDACDSIAAILDEVDFEAYQKRQPPFVPSVS